MARGVVMLVVAAVALGFIGTASANLVANGSFELGIDPGLFTDVAAPNCVSITAWCVSAGHVDYVGTQWVAADGDRSIDMDGSVGPSTDLDGTIEQNLATNAGTMYEVRFALAGNPGDPVIKGLEVTAGTTVVVFHFDSTNSTFADMGWVDQSFLFTANSSTTRLAFRSLTEDEGGTPSAGATIDNVRVEAVPTPAALLLLVAGIGVTPLLRRRRT